MFNKPGSESKAHCRLLLEEEYVQLNNGIGAVIRLRTRLAIHDHVCGRTNDVHSIYGRRIGEYAMDCRNQFLPMGRKKCLSSILNRTMQTNVQTNRLMCLIFCDNIYFSGSESQTSRGSKETRKMISNRQWITIQLSIEDRICKSFIVKSEILFYIIIRSRLDPRGFILECSIPCIRCRVSSIK